MERKETSSGQVFYLTSTINDYLAEQGNLPDEADVILVGVSLTEVPFTDAEFQAGTSASYSISDASGAIELRWPTMLWILEESGLTPEMRECGYFYAAMLNIRHVAGNAYILKIVKQRTPATTKAKAFLSRLFGSGPALSLTTG